MYTLVIQAKSGAPPLYLHCDTTWISPSEKWDKNPESQIRLSVDSLGIGTRIKRHSILPFRICPFKRVVKMSRLMCRKCVIKRFIVADVENYERGSQLATDTVFLGSSLSWITPPLPVVMMSMSAKTYATIQCVYRQ
jgi:hypothetical protein